jgi:hypothetical protein
MIWTHLRKGTSKFHRFISKMIALFDLISRALAVEETMRLSLNQRIWKSNNQCRTLVLNTSSILIGMICSRLLIELWHTPHNSLVEITSKTSRPFWIDWPINWCFSFWNRLKFKDQTSCERGDWGSLRSLWFTKTFHVICGVWTIGTTPVAWTETPHPVLDLVLAISCRAKGVL